MQETTIQFRNERAIVRRILRDLLSAGYSVKLTDDHETSEPIKNPKEGIEFAMWDDKDGGRKLWNLEEFHIVAERDGRIGTIWIITDNGDECLDMIADYSVSLRHIVEPIMASI